MNRPVLSVVVVVQQHRPQLVDLQQTYPGHIMAILCGVVSKHSTQLRTIHNLLTYLDLGIYDCSVKGTIAMTFDDGPYM